MTETQFRILQKAGRRFAIKLEPAFWATLEEAALAADTRLNDLVAQVAEEAAGGNLTAHLRVFALEWLGQARDDEKPAPSTAKAFDMSTLLHALPVPSLVLTRDFRVSDANAAVARHLRIMGENLAGRPLSAMIRLQLPDGRSGIFETLDADPTAVLESHAISTLPGRVRFDKATILAAERVRTDGVDQVDTAMVFIGGS